MPRETDAADALANEGSPEADRHLTENFGMTVRQVREFDPQTLDATRACKFLGLPPKRFDQLAAQPEARKQWVESVARQKKDLIETFPQAGTELKGMLEAIRKFALRKCLKPDGPALLVDGGGAAKSKSRSADKGMSTQNLVIGGGVLVAVVLVGVAVIVMMPARGRPEQQAKSHAAVSPQAVPTSLPVVASEPPTEAAAAPMPPVPQPVAVTPRLAEPFRVNSVWNGDDPPKELRVTVRDGAMWTGMLKIGDKIERIVSGVIEGGKLQWLAKDVRAVRGGVGGDNQGTFGSDKDGDKIDFVWQDSKGASGRFTLRRRNGPAEPAKAYTDGAVVTSIDFGTVKPGVYPFANSKYQNHQVPKMPAGCIVECWKDTSVAEFRVAELQGKSGLGIANLNDDISAQILVPNLGKLKANATYRTRVEYFAANDAIGKLRIRVVGGQYPTLYGMNVTNTDGKWKTATLDFVQPAGLPIDLQIYNSVVGEGNRLTVRKIDILETKSAADPSGSTEPSLKDLTGAWDSDFGKVTLNAPKSGMISGHWDQSATKKGIMTNGTFTPGTRTLTFAITQPWNNQKGSATFTLSADGNKLDGTWKHSSGNGKWQMTRVEK